MGARGREEMAAGADLDLGGAVFVASLAIYFVTLHPSVAGGDAGELATVAHTLGVPHPPGYPTMAVLTYCAERAVRFPFPTLSVGLVQNAAHAVLSAGANTLLYYASSALAGSSAAGVLSAFLFGFAPIVWTYATHIEVFALNNLLLSALELTCIVYGLKRFPANEDSGSQPPKKQPEAARESIMTIGAFLSGLALTNQHTSVLYVVPFIAWVACLDYRTVFRPRVFAKLFLCFALGLLPYIYLPISASLWPNPNSWGDCSTVDGFLTHLLRKEYGTFSLASKESPHKMADFGRAWAFYLKDTHNQTLHCMWIFLIPSFLAALKRSFRTRSVTVDTLFFATLFFYLNFFHYLCNLPIDQPLFYGVQQRFWIQPLSLVAILVGKGFSDVGSAGLRRVPGMRPGVQRCALLLAAVVVAACQVRGHHHAMDQSRNHIVRDFGRAILAPLPRGAVVLTKGDIMINSARYVQTLDGVRPDVILIDQELLTYAWYAATVKTVHPEVALPGAYYFPNRRGAFDIAALLAANKNKRVFLAHGFKDGDHSWRGRYATVPFGIIHEVVPVRVAGDRSLKRLRKYIKATRGAVPAPAQFSLPEPGKYADWTWEQVVKSDYWMAHHNRAYALLDWHSAAAAAAPDDLGTDTPAYVAAAEARETFALLVEHDQPPNGIAHRNLGVLLQSFHKYHPEDIGVVVQMRDAFASYLEIVRNKTEAPAGLDQIQQAVDHYSDYITSMRGS
ncbi:Transmembrane protein 260-like protein [Diplonema papillatum]|nr:Transmembrane protein 260-like protein [Diplonema papillatum]